MGKKRKGGNVPKKDFAPTKRREPRDNDLQSSLLDPTDRSFIYDEVNEFESNRDLVSLQTAQTLMRRKEAPREQVLAIDGSSSDDDDDDDDYDDESSKDSEEDPDSLFMEDDIVAEPEYRDADERAWGNKKHHYFGTDTTDEKIKWNIYNQDEDMAQVEEETARKLQERMASELKDLVADDLILQSSQKEETKLSSTKDLVETDVSALSRSRKLQLLKRESPEFLPLIEDLKHKCEELQCILSPLMKIVKLGRVPEGPVRQYITTKYRLVLNYVSTISMYMLVKCSSKNVRDHPVVGRLAQYRQLLQELEPCDNKLAGHLGKILSDPPAVEKMTEVKSEKPRKRKRELKILKKSKSAKIDEKTRLMSLLKETPAESKDGKSKRNKMDMLNVMEASSDEEEAEVNEVVEHRKHELDPDEKRAIGYTIAKNKGLMPYRSKDQRNPRVRYRNKFKKKMTKRKSQVRPVRKEIERYGGEMTGIKSHTIKSVKIKS